MPTQDVKRWKDWNYCKINNKKIFVKIQMCERRTRNGGKRIGAVLGRFSLIDFRLMPLNVLDCITASKDVNV